MSKEIIVIKSTPNCIIPRPVERKVFEWDSDEFCYSQEAFDYIEKLMMSNCAFTVDTSIAKDYSDRQMAIVEHAFR